LSGWGVVWLTGVRFAPWWTSTVWPDPATRSFLRGVAWVAQMMIDEGWISEEAQKRSPLPDLPDTER